MPLRVGKEGTHMVKRTTKKRGSPTAPAPDKRTCGTMQVHERPVRTVPGYREARDTSENQALRTAMFLGAGRIGRAEIPVVVHVVYKTAAQNLSDTPIESRLLDGQPDISTWRRTKS